RLEPFRDLLEALVARSTRETRVHLGVLVGLTGHRRLQVVGGRSDRDARDGVADLGEEVEVPEGVSGLAFGDRAEQRGDVRVSLDVGLLREVEVTAIGLALARERLLQVLVRLASLEIGHRSSSLLSDSIGTVVTSAAEDHLDVVDGEMAPVANRHM